VYYERKEKEKRWDKKGHTAELKLPLNELHPSPLQAWFRKTVPRVSLISINLTIKKKMANFQ